MNITKLAIALLLISVVAARFVPNPCTKETYKEIEEVKRKCYEDAKKIMWSCDKEQAQRNCAISGNPLARSNF